MEHSIAPLTAQRREERIGPGLHEVVANSVEVFFVDFGEESAIARRRYVGTLHSGDVCSGSRRVGANAYFAVRAAMSSANEDVIRRADPDALDARHLTRWLEILCAAPLKGPIPRVTRPVVGGEYLIGRANEVMVLGSEGGLVRLSSGSAYLWGRRSRVSTFDGGPWPLTPHAWWLLREESRMEVIPWDEAPCGADLAEAFDRHTALMVDLLVQDGRTRDGVELKRLGRLDTEDRALMSRSCTSLASVLQSTAEPLQTRDPLESAAARVAVDLGMTIKPGSSGSDRRSGVRLRTMARVNHFRVRRVALRGNWWLHESSPMLAVWQDESGQSQPVALIPGGNSRIRESRGRGRLPRILSTAAWRARGSRFKLWNPADGSEAIVDQNIAARIAPFAYHFYPPAPERPSALLTIARHAVRGGSRDVWPLLLLGIVAGGLSALTPVLTGKVYDVAIPDASRTQLTYIVALLLSIAAASLLMQFVRAVAILRLETRIDDSLQSAVWDHLLRLPAVFFRRFTAGDLATRAGAVAQIRYLLSSAATGVMLTGIFGAWYLGLMFYYDARMAAWLSAALLGLSAASLFLARIQMRHQRRATAIQSRMSGLVLQLITGISKLRVAGAEIRAFSRWAEAFADQRRWYVRGRRANNLLVALQSTGPLLLLAVAYGLLFRTSEPALSTGELLAFQTALVALIASVGSLTQIFAATCSAVPLFEQLLPILECEPEQTATRADPGELTGDVDIRHVTFAYNADAPPVLDDVSLHVPAGSFVALVGPSGSGKSSILRLLLGFESPSSGSIYFDGQDIVGLDPLALRRQFGVVLQDAGIIAGDVFMNIAGATDATLDDAWEAAQMAGLADDIRAMPMGMHTVIDQNGTTISGGQRQRMMIARAIVSRPRILLMDEATSALDNLTQEQVSRSLAKLNVTRIVVAHRLTTIMDADVIYVLDGGRIVEHGSYSALMKEKGLFYRLARRQMLEVRE